MSQGKRRLSTEEGQADSLLSQMETAAGVMSSAKLLIHWLDRNPSSLINDYETFRNDVMMSALDLVAILVRTCMCVRVEIINNIVTIGVRVLGNVFFSIQQNNYDSAQMLESVSYLCISSSVFAIDCGKLTQDLVFL